MDITWGARSHFVLVKIDQKSFVKWSFPGQSLSYLNIPENQFWIKYKRQPGADDQRGPVYALRQPIDAFGIKACIPSIG